MGEPPKKEELHPRNRHRGLYDFRALTEASPDLGGFLRMALNGRFSIDFTDPAAVRALNRAILLETYGIQEWDIPEGYLCPPIPGRADYLHQVADLLAEAGGTIPQGPSVRILDIGTGANIVYPLIGHREYGWAFVGTDIDKVGLDSAKRVLKANPGLDQVIALRLQKNHHAIFAGVVKAGETFDLVLCNPPFHASREEAQAGSQRKWQKLGRESRNKIPPRNFGGHGAELWCEGGEVGFIRRMMEESRSYASQIRWFTTLVSKSANLSAVHRALRQIEAQDIRTIEMAQGHKQSRFVAWTYQPNENKVIPSGRREKR